MLTLVIGGAASGKSAYAERLCCTDAFLREPSGGGLVQGNIPKERPGFGTGLYYIATMQPFGKEAQDRIRKHRVMRADKGFETLECFTARSLRELSLPSGAAVLLEDLGNLCANELFSEAVGDEPRLSADMRDQQAAKEMTAAEAVTEAVSSLSEKCGNLVIVTNEVFSGGAEYEGDTLSYLRMLGQVNNAVAALADRVTEVQCGVPVMIKDDFETCADRKTKNDAGPGKRPGTGVERNRPGTGVEEKRPGMLFVTGPMFSGKREAAAELLGISAEEILICENVKQDISEKGRRGIAEVQLLAAGCRDEKELEQLAEKLSEYDVVISTETGCGVVPMNSAEREAREKAGRLNCLLAARAETVIRVFCGIPQVIRGASRPSAKIKK